MKKLLGLLVVGLMVLFMAGPAAASYNFTMGNGSGFSGDALNWMYLTLNYSMDSNLSGYSFTLNNGESETFNFAYLKVDGYDAYWDTSASKSITAIIDFDNPNLTALLGGDAQAYVNGTWSWDNDTWNLIWDAPLVFDLGSGQTMTVDLSDILGASVFTDGWCDPGDLVQLTVSYTASQVPVPAAVWLLGSGLVGLAGLRRKFRA